MSSTDSLPIRRCTVLRHFIPGLLAAGALAVSPIAGAAVFCVNSAASLQNALITSAANAESDEIRIVVGTYLVPSMPVSGFRYVSSQIGYIAISGGWGPPAPIGALPLCQSRIDNPNLTIIDGQLQTEGLVIQPGPLTGTVKVENLTIQGGSSAGSGGGLYAAPYDPAWPGSLSVRSIVFRGNQAVNSGGGLYASVPIGSLEVKNSVFTSNSAGVASGGAEILVNGVDGVVANNTAADNTASSGGAGLRVGGNSPIDLINNALFDNTDVDLQLGGVDVTLVNNFFNSRNGLTPLMETGTLSGDPLVGGGTYGLAPVPGSSLIDYGQAVPNGLPPRDADGGQRLVGPAVDVGAYEAQIFADGLEGGVR